MYLFVSLYVYISTFFSFLFLNDCQLAFYIGLFDAVQHSDIHWFIYLSIIWLISWLIHWLFHWVIHYWIFNPDKFCLTVSHWLIESLFLPVVSSYSDWLIRDSLIFYPFCPSVSFSPSLFVSLCLSVCVRQSSLSLSRPVGTDWLVSQCHGCDWRNELFPFALSFRRLIACDQRNAILMFLIATQSVCIVLMCL